MIAIEPYVGAGPIHFGMTENQVQEAVGAPSATSLNAMGDKELVYHHMSVTLSPLGVIQIAFLPGADVDLSGISVFGNRQALKDLCALDGDPKESLGFVVMFKLGITVTGLHDGQHDQRAISAFAEGLWDGFRADMVDFSLPAK